MSGGTGIAALWRDGAVINLTSDIPTGQGSQAVAINDRGDIVGTMRAGGAGAPWHAYIYKAMR